MELEEQKKLARIALYEAAAIAQGKIGENGEPILPQPLPVGNHPSDVISSLGAFNYAEVLRSFIHSYYCEKMHCPNCLKLTFRVVTDHVKACPIGFKFSNSCPLCFTAWNILQVHSSQCTNAYCDVPNCDPIKWVIIQKLDEEWKKSRNGYA